MSAAAKCDRCESLYEHAPSAVRVEYHVTESVDAGGAPTQGGYDADLCPDCSAEFLKWVKHDET